MRRVQVQGVQPGVAQGEGDQGEVGLGAGGQVWVEVMCGAVAAAAVLEGVGEEAGGRDGERRGGGRGAWWEEKGQRAGGRCMVCGGQDAELEVGEAEEGLAGRGGWMLAPGSGKTVG